MSASPPSDVLAARSLWFVAPGRIELRDEPLRSPRAGEVRVRAIVSGISHGTEMLVYRGKVPRELELDLPTLRGSFGFPIAYGYASVGRIVAVGPDVAAPGIDDLVFVYHPHQTEYVVPAGLAIPLGAGLDPELGVFLANLETAANVVLDAAPRLGDRVVVFGQGVVGLLVTQLLRRAGPRTIVAVDPIARRRELSERLGADRAVTPDEVADAVRDATGGAGMDVAIEASGNATALAQAIDAVGFQGTVVVCSWYGTTPVPLPLGAAFHRRRLRLVSSQVSNLDPALAPRWDRSRRTSLARELLGELVLAPLVTHRVPFERASEAYALVDRHPEETVQVVLTY